MGRVIALHQVESAVELVSVREQFVEQSYAQLNAVPGFVGREGQRQLSLELATALVEGQPFAAEAPTGTGKTLAYLIGALAAAQEMNPVQPVPIVVATATVGLQSQIVTGDLPFLVKAGIVTGGNYTLAKGRGRYFCIDAAERLTDGRDSSAQTDFFDESSNVENARLEGYKELLAQWNDGAWSGDFDSYPGKLPQQTPKVAAASQTCLANKCAHYNSCPFFSARRALSSARIIVANHDLVLADLAMDREGIDPLFPGARYLAIFDEAHHLPDKAQDAGSGSVALVAAREAYRNISNYNQLWVRVPDIVRLFEKAKLDEGCFQATALLGGLDSLLKEAASHKVDEDYGHLRFAGGAVPEGLLSASEYVLSHIDLLLTAFTDATAQLRSSSLIERNPSLRPTFSNLLYAGGYYVAELQSLKKALTLFTGASRAVRWLGRDGEEITLNSAPLEGGEVLQDLLWGNPRAVVAMVSATIRDFGGYDRFRMRLGLEQLRTLTLPHIFPYHKCELQLVDMRNSPKFEDRAKYEAELMQIMPRMLNPREGTLVLFPSRALMARVTPLLRQRFGRQVVRIQYEKGIKELIKEHREAVDAGNGSILCGLATMAEGLDLPGKYCTHVAICTLPFSAPSSPVEQELQELLGRDYFSKKALPDTLVKLTQMVGRLMRRETDEGRITVFDNRITHTRWGVKLLSALPPFQRRRVVPHVL